MLPAPGRMALSSALVAACLALLFAGCPESTDAPVTAPSCPWVSSDKPACCNNGAGCTGGLSCSTLTCACLDVQDACAGSYDGGFDAGADGGVDAGSDAGTDAGSDGGSTPDAGPLPTGTITADGGTVDRLWFATTGDTRPGSCDDTAGYPRAAIEQLARGMKSLQVQFALDLGDHMYVCNGSTAAANTQMGFYKGAMALGPSTWFLTMGNHECATGKWVASTGGTGGAYSCTDPTADANYGAYLGVLGRAKPYYSFDVHTTAPAGLARFVVVADDSWGPDQKAWLSSTLADADRTAKYTIVARHHPMTGSRAGNPDIVSIIEAHKYSLLLTAHNHDYEHGTDHGGRAVVIGLGGASPTLPPGFATILQTADGKLQFTLRDGSGNPTGVPWSVDPQ